MYRSERGHHTDFLGNTQETRAWGDPAPGFEGRDGALYPVYHVMRGLYGASGRRRLAARSSAAREVQSLAVDSGAGVTLWLANLTGETRRVAIEGAQAATAAASVLDASTFEAAAAGPGGFGKTERQITLEGLSLAPYAVVRLRIGG